MRTPVDYLRHGKIDGPAWYGWFTFFIPGVKPWKETRALQTVSLPIVFKHSGKRN
jgi:hypothetical protein